MEIPSLPTDNLYKFMAIFGIVLMIFAFVFPFRGIDDLSNELHEAELEARIHEAQEQRFFASGKERSEEEEIDKIIFMLKYKSNLEKLREKSNRFEQNKWIFKISYGAGSFVASWGFLLWYWKVQRHLDRILYNQASDTLN